MFWVMIGCLVLYVCGKFAKAFDKRDQQIQSLEDERTEAICSSLEAAHRQTLNMTNAMYRMAHELDEQNRIARQKLAQDD